MVGSETLDSHSEKTTLVQQQEDALQEGRFSESLGSSVKEGSGPRKTCCAASCPSSPASSPLNFWTPGELDLGVYTKHILQPHTWVVEIQEHYYQEYALFCTVVLRAYDMRTRASPMATGYALDAGFMACGPPLHDR